MSLVVFANWDWASLELPVDNWWFCGFVLVVLIVAIWGVARLTASATEEIDPAEIDRQMLTAVSELRSRGDLTQEEFRSIKSRLVDRLSDLPQATDSDDSSHKEQQEQVDEGQLDQSTETPEGTKLSAVAETDPIPDASQKEDEKNDVAE